MSPRVAAGGWWWALSRPRAALWRAGLLPCRAMSPLAPTAPPLLAAAALLLSGPARAQEEGASGIALRVAVDDRVGKRLTAPRLVVDQPGVEPVVFQDDGQIPGDVPGDRIFVARITVAKAEHLSLGVAEPEGPPLGMLTVSLPASGSSDVALKTATGAPALLLDARAPSMPGAAAADPGGSRLVVTAAPTGDTVSADDEGADRITVRFLVDDRAADRIDGDARVVVDQSGAQPARLVDDGETAEDEDADDDIYAAELQVSRAQYLGFSILLDGRDEPLGELSVFLPSTSEALVRVRTSEDAAGLELMTEPTALGSADAPAAPGGGGAVASSGGGGGDRFVHVLWVLIALASVGFTWLRRVVAQEWAAEVRPVLRKLDRYLDRELGEAPPPGAPTAAPPPDDDTQDAP